MYGCGFGVYCRSHVRSRCPFNGPLVAGNFAVRAISYHISAVRMGLRIVGKPFAHFLFVSRQVGGDKAISCRCRGRIVRAAADKPVVLL